jgi:hypothetical protein
MACDEQAMMYRSWLQDATARGVIPEGIAAEDYEALGLLVPEQLRPAQPASAPAPAFSCDPAE